MINVAVAVPLIPLFRRVTHYHHHLVSVLASEREPAFPLHPEAYLPRQCYHRVRLVLVLNRLRRRALEVVLSLGLPQHQLCRHHRELVGPALYRRRRLELVGSELHRLRRRRELVGSALYRLRRRRELVGLVSDEEELPLGHGHRLEDLFAPHEWY